MILITGITEDDRRERIKALANIPKSYTDAKLDKIIDNADDIAQVRMQTEIPSRTLIVVSNLICAKLIRQGLPDSADEVRSLEDQIMKIIESHNDKAPEQNAGTVLVTSGIGEGRGTFG